MATRQDETGAARIRRLPDPRTGYEKPGETARIIVSRGRIVWNAMATAAEAAAELAFHRAFDPAAMLQPGRVSGR